MTLTMTLLDIHTVVSRCLRSEFYHMEVIIINDAVDLEFRDAASYAPQCRTIPMHNKFARHSYVLQSFGILP